MIERQLLAQVEDPVPGRIDVLNSAVKFADASVGVHGHAPTLDEHSEAVLKALLGDDDARVAPPLESGVLRREAV